MPVFGEELVERPRRLALMNLYLHGLRPTIYLGDTIYAYLTIQNVITLTIVTYAITLLASLYPALLASRLEPIEALHAQ